MYGALVLCNGVCGHLHLVKYNLLVGRLLPLYTYVD